MALALPVLAAFGIGLALGGRPSSLARLELRAPWLFFAAVALQLIAFPLPFFPWDTPHGVASVLWLLSYGLLIVAAAKNRRITGVPIIAAGMLLNALAIVANRGTMPVLPGAMHDAGRSEVVVNNSTAAGSPMLPWLVDRWAAPEWIPLANVFSVGDVVIAVGAFVMVLAAMGVRLPRFASSRAEPKQ